jgi:hypothetical protein
MNRNTKTGSFTRPSIIDTQPPIRLAFNKEVQFPSFPSRGIFQRHGSARPHACCTVPIDERFFQAMHDLKKAIDQTGIALGLIAPPLFKHALLKARQAPDNVEET